MFFYQKPFGKFFRALNVRPVYRYIAIYTHDILSVVNIMNTFVYAKIQFNGNIEFALCEYSKSLLCHFPRNRVRKFVGS